jgi:glycosyltransferase involved in cell wall biosynthesis
MKITVILCTYNRCQSLSKALESLASTTFSEPVEWEIVVVDNNSKDQTREVIEEYCSRYPGRFRYLFEGQQGKSHALNAGILASRGDILAFVDDDVTVDPKWLQNLTAAVDEDEWAGAGGRILPQPNFTPPSWLAIEGRHSMAGILAIFDLGDKVCELDRPPFGTNMAFPKKVFEKYGGFRTDMGPCPGSEIRNEDTEFGRRIMARGHRLRYEPSAVVCHPVPQDRLTKEYFLGWSFDYGRARVREKGYGPRVLGLPRHYLTIPKVVLVDLSVRTLQWICSLNPQRRFFRKCRVWVMAGQIVETIVRARSRDNRNPQHRQATSLGQTK